MNMPELINSMNLEPVTRYDNDEVRWDLDLR